MTTPTLVDGAERKRIEHGGLHETLFVEAGAGTGKTFELVERLVNLIVSGGVRLSAVAAITFTEAAASELRDRVREAFEKRLAAGPAAVERAACEQALGDLDQAAITTLHGFCLRVLSEHPLAVGLPPRIDILDEVSSQLAFQDRWHRFVDELYDDVTAEDLVLRAWALGIEIDTDSKMKSSFKDVAGIFEDSWDRLDHLVEQVVGTVQAIDLAPLESAVADVRVLLETNSNPDDRLAERIREVVASVRDVLGEPDPDRRVRSLCSQAPSWKASGKGAQANWDDVKSARSTVDHVGEVGQRIAAEARNEVLRQLSIRLARFTRSSAEHRRQEGRLDFHDLLVLARRLLRTSDEARSALGARYERLLLDEFQDTDPMQIEVAVLIASAVEDADGDRRWEELEPAPGRLFFVGDPKQSIYRFRRADIALFLQARDRFTGDSPVVLRQNFRTVEPVLAWVNHVFSQMMPSEIAGSQPAYHRLTAHREAQPGVDHRVVMLGGARDAKAGKLRTEEATAVASAVASVGTHPGRWPIFDRATKSWRSPSWSDVTVLIPTRTSLRQLEDALDMEKIPYRVATGSLVFDTQEVREALDALRAIDDPGDQLALVSALRSPLYACSDVDLFTYREAGGRWDIWWRADGLDAEHPVVRALEHLRSLASIRWWHEPSALLDRLLRERNAFALAFGSRRPREVWRRLRFIVDQARAFEEAGGGGLRAFLDWADLQRSEGTRVHEPLLAETDDDAVSILTIHGSKGLEFPITVVSGATTAVAGRRGGPKVIWNGDVPEVRLSAANATEHFDRLNDIEAEMDVHERRRLLYVACTRAQDHLVLSTFHKEGTESYGRWLTEASVGVEETLCRRLEPGDEAAVSVTSPAAVGATPVVDERDAWLVQRAAVLARNRQPQFISATALAAELAELDHHAPVADADDDVPPDEEVPASPAVRLRRGRRGTAVGSAVHAALQFLRPGDTEERVLQLATQHSHAEMVPELAESIAAMAMSALQSPSVVAASTAARSWREIYVSAALGTRAIEGYIDLLYETPEGLVLVDYKTDTVSGFADADAKLERYTPQLAAYAVALEQSTGLTVVDARLVFCRPAGAIERSVVELVAAKERIRQLVA